MLLWLFLVIGLVLWWWVQGNELCPSCGTELPMSIGSFERDHCPWCGWRRR